MRRLDGIGAASVLGGVGAASVPLGAGVGGLVEGNWFRMRPRSAKYHALTASSLLWSMSAPPSRKARSVFLFFAATFVRSRSSLTALLVINADHRTSIFSSRRAARASAAPRNKQLAGTQGEKKWEAGVPYLILNAGAALRASRDLLDDPMPSVARRLDEPPTVRHFLRPALHEDVFKVGVDEFALVELGLDVLPIRVDALGEVVRIQGDEFWHMTRVLRLGINDRVELFDGAGGLVEGSIQKVDKNGSDVELLENARLIAPQGIQWHVFAAFGTLKGGRADWLIEKCTELGASSVTPLLTERCHTIAENRVDRLQRLVLAAVKQCQRVHDMSLKPPIQIHDLPLAVSQSKLAFLASAEAPPVLSVLPKCSSEEESGLLIIGPEGDFTEEEVKVLKAAGAVPVGLGPCRLRVETATISLLSALMLWSDAAQHQETQRQRG
ncbi:Ribosomal RNA small subunit methyltransferase E [Triticum urartu]|uniref:16S rRNA (uracil(1498)-N(3))-methyltransferase n=1 Tax=Triticum urartu TaxID=4572 RepID=M7YKL5_TRIUA|nr:Ribosomal RNA small subunit methyltransferase E [Triticum urartu]